MGGRLFQNRKEVSYSRKGATSTGPSAASRRQRVLWKTEGVTSSLGLGEGRGPVGTQKRSRVLSESQIPQNQKLSGRARIEEESRLFLEKRRKKKKRNVLSW